MAKWTAKKNLTVDEKVVFTKHELTATKKQLKYFWLIHTVQISIIIYLLVRSL